MATKTIDSESSYQKLASHPWLLEVRWGDGILNGRVLSNIEGDAHKYELHADAGEGC